ncbi:glycoside hydrolase family 57 protein [Edaphobacter sp.]|uniref:glycoside hydrolase family 57 protein n=1 Tax=Edaphobacter sp. TaxID=1934404 RepID=UPI002DB87B5C|nr:1,4-alpha-glucan branching protein domain-containing protein [Edaphobacter sp.]HEU5341973.1 1,4-alpha-glucan branching protein domain-containing protein [Edaphobacter sp.]
MRYSILTKASPNQASRPAGFLTFTLHAHLPYVVNHGTWPHGMEWLHEAAAETYLPLLRMLKNLERDHIRFNCNLNLSPILLEQLAHPVFIEEFPNYLGRKIVAAREDEAYFIQAGETHLAETARFWHRFFSQALEDFEGFNRDIIGAFRHFNDTSLIDIITCGATHGYMPLLGTDESVRAQVRTAVETHIRHFGRHPRGIWAPECGYRPAGFWQYPVACADGQTPAGFDRIGVEQALSESGIEFFFVDTHLVEESVRTPSPYELLNGSVPADAELEKMTHRPYRSLYQPYYVDGTYDKRYATTIFPRDPRTGIQVWSGDGGYPGDGVYLDFHKKRWPGGHRYWRVTGSKVDMGDKQPYYPQQAAERVKSHAAHFVHLVYEALQSGFNDGIPPILCSPFDAELFGHWWFEGPLWLEAIARNLHDYPTGLEMISCAEYLDRYPRAGFISMHEGSWGAEGTNHVWMNPETSWTWTHIYPAELFTRDVSTAGHWRASAQGKRIAQQLCRELLLLESSDWQFLITTGAARDYAEIRFLTHNDQFNEVKAIWQTFESTGSITPEQEKRLAEIEVRDGIFPDVDPGLWVAGAKQPRIEAQPATLPQAAATA